jgi:3-methyladenine DNA glycosylase AlkD
MVALDKVSLKLVHIQRMRRTIRYSPAQIKRDLRRLADPTTRESQQRFSKEPLHSLGVRTPDLRRLATAAAREYRQADLGFDEILTFADALWRAGTLEERAVAVLLLSKFKKHFERRHWRHFDRYVDSLSNWGETDALCGNVLALLLEIEPDLVSRLEPWTRSRNRWRRRAAAVALVPAARRGRHHEFVYVICDRLAHDRDDLVEKAVGWLLKEVSRTQPQSVADYLLANRDVLSRTTIRYAAEKLPAKLRERALTAGH